jgi:hypothetical protein
MKKPRFGGAFLGSVCALLLKRDTTRPHRSPRGCSRYIAYFGYFSISRKGAPKSVSQPSLQPLKVGLREDFLGMLSVADVNAIESSMGNCHYCIAIGPSVLCKRLMRAGREMHVGRAKNWRPCHRKRNYNTTTRPSPVSGIIGAW